MTITYPFKGKVGSQMITGTATVKGVVLSCDGESCRPSEGEWLGTRAGTVTTMAILHDPLAPRVALRSHHQQHRRHPAPAQCGRVDGIRAAVEGPDARPSASPPLPDFANA